MKKTLNLLMATICFLGVTQAMAEIEIRRAGLNTVCYSNDNTYVSNVFAYPVEHGNGLDASLEFSKRHFIRSIQEQYKVTLTEERVDCMGKFRTKEDLQRIRKDILEKSGKKQEVLMEAAPRNVAAFCELVYSRSHPTRNLEFTDYSSPVFRVPKYPTIEEANRWIKNFAQAANSPDKESSALPYCYFDITVEKLKQFKANLMARSKQQEQKANWSTNFIEIAWGPNFGPPSREELKRQQEEERAKKLAEQKAKQEADRLKKLEADKLAKEQAERERQRKVEDTRREWEAKLHGQNQSIQENAAPIMAQVDDAVFQEVDKAAKKEKKNLQQFMEAVVMCSKPNSRGGFRCEGPLTAMDGSASDISGFRSPEEMVAKNMNAQCPDLRPLPVSGQVKVWGCGFAATGGMNAKDISGGLVIQGRQTYYCRPKQLSCRNQTPPSNR